MKEKTIQEIKKNFLENYNNYVQTLNDFNLILMKLATQTEEILSFIETTQKVGEELEVPKENE